jgi:acylphosphatase
VEGKAALRAIVRGRVQGVGFRDFVWRRARFLGLVGYVRNLPDGRSVEVVAEGQRDDLEQLLEFLRSGPPAARVEQVDVEWGEASDRFQRFVILA